DGDEDAGCGEERRGGGGGERGQPARDLGHSVAARGTGQGGGGGVGQVGSGGPGEPPDDLLDAERPEQEGDDGADLVPDERPDADPDRGEQARCDDDSCGVAGDGRRGKGQRVPSGGGEHQPSPGRDGGGGQAQHDPGGGCGGGPCGPGTGAGGAGRGGGGVGGGGGVPPGRPRAPEAGGEVRADPAAGKHHPQPRGGVQGRDGEAAAASGPGGGDRGDQAVQPGGQGQQRGGQRGGADLQQFRADRGDHVSASLPAGAAVSWKNMSSRSVGWVVISKTGIARPAARVPTRSGVVPETSSRPAAATRAVAPSAVRAALSSSGRGVRTRTVCWVPAMRSASGEWVMSRPRSRMSTLPAICVTSASRWLDTSTVRPWLARPRSRSRSQRTPSRSSPLAGSSS